jgi:ABC-type nitrate/sulfonate/bicarbonate transport system permease component
MHQWWVRSERVRWLLMMLAGLLAFWEAMVWFTGVKPFILPAPSQIALRAWLDRGDYPAHILGTLRTAAAGFIAGSLIAFMLGLA